MKSSCNCYKILILFGCLLHQHLAIIAANYYSNVKDYTKGEIEVLCVKLQALGYVYAIENDTNRNKLQKDPIKFGLSIDPLAEQFPSQSPYVAMDNNPIFKIDPTGESAMAAFDFDKHSIHVTANVNIYGKGATEEVRAEIQKKTDWIYNTRMDGNRCVYPEEDRIIKFTDSETSEEWIVTYDIRINLIKRKEVPRNINKLLHTENYVRITMVHDFRSYVRERRTGVWAYWGIGPNNRWPGVEPGTNLNVGPHEIGHFLGVDDYYIDYYTEDGEYERSVPMPGWENSIMSMTGGWTGKEAYLSLKNSLQEAKKANQEYHEQNKEKIENGELPLNLIENVPITTEGGYR